MLWYFVVSFLSEIIEGFAGFGSTAVALPFLALKMDVGESVALLGVNAFVVAIVLTCTQFKKINWKEFLKITLLVVPLLPLGVLAFGALSRYGNALKLVLGCVITLVGIYYCYFAFLKKEEPRSLSKPAQIAALVGGAVLQGMFSTGGALITLYASERMHDKGEFRATMSAMWLAVNAVAIPLRAVFLHVYTKPVWINALSALPFVLGGVLVGMLFHKKIGNGGFRKAIYVILLAGGIASTVHTLACIL
ncbi:MAG TPA: sulfite exporter TauE/SafE family protein [Clostridia bacterium]|nr:sulfite exporter TauE/SafE family protein [Clostridia bacterium]